MEYIKYTKEAVEYVKSKDEKMKALIEEIGDVKREKKPDLYTAIIDTIIGQQISTAAHKTVADRFFAKFQDKTAKEIYNTPDEEIQKLGFSFRKVSYIKNFLEKIINNEIDLNSLYKKSDEEVIKEITSIKGLGVWSAQMLMTSAMDRKDIIAYDDLAIRRGIMKLYSLDELSKKDFHLLTDKFSPYRTIAAFYFWENSK